MHHQHIAGQTVTSRPVRAELQTSGESGKPAAGPRAVLRSEPLADLQHLLRDTRGAAMLEYAILVGAIAIAGSLGLLAVGIALFRSFHFVRGFLLVPVP